MAKITYFISKLLILCLHLYRWFIRPILGERCRFYPSCSTYSIQALQIHGLVKGIYFILRRLLRCQPFNQGGVDPIPTGKKHLC